MARPPISATAARRSAAHVVEQHAGRRGREGLLDLRRAILPSTSTISVCGAFAGARASRAMPPARDDVVVLDEHAVVEPEAVIVSRRRMRTAYFSSGAGRAWSCGCRDARAGARPPPPRSAGSGWRCRRALQEVERDAFAGRIARPRPGGDRRATAPASKDSPSS